MKKRFNAVTVLLLTTSLYGPAFAEESPVAVTLDEVLVTATRTEQNLKNIGGTSVTVISEEEIAAKQQNTVADVLRGTPGLDIKSDGGMGTKTSIFLRGSDSKNTLVLVDGIMFNDPSSTNRLSDIANLTTDNIERIEIVRGPISVLYGSNASAGVINIITKSGSGDPKTTLGVEGGSYDTYKFYGGNAGAIDKLNYSINLSYIDTDGFSTANDDNNKIPHGGNTSEDDGYDNTTLSGKAGYEISPNFDLVATLRYIDSEVEFDDFGNGYTGDRFNFSTWPPTPEPYGRKKLHTENDQYFGRIDAKNNFLENFLDSDLYYQYSKHDRQDYDNDGNKSYDYLGKSQEIGWQGTLSFSDINNLTIGTSYFEEEMESKFQGIDNEDADIKSLWLQEQITFFDNLELVAGLRYDDHDQFGDKTTYRIAPSLLTSFGTLFKASYGTGFRAPSLFELYSSYGNVNLDAEESEGWDVGFEQEVADGTVLFGITYFRLTFEDRIEYDWLTSKYQQADGDTKTKGIESFVQWQPTNTLSLFLNYTYTDTEAPDGSRLTHRPLNKVALGSQYQYKKASFNIDIRWVDERDASAFAMDLNGNSIETLDAYTIVNLAVRYNLNEMVQLYGRIDNLFDEEYEEVWSYATPGISGYAGIKTTF